MAAVMEGLWHLVRIRFKPPVTGQTLRMVDCDSTFDTTKEHQDFGYVPLISWHESHLPDA
jgi:hypothetical protein